MHYHTWEQSMPGRPNFQTKNTDKYVEMCSNWTDIIKAYKTSKDCNVLFYQNICHNQ